MPILITMVLSIFLIDKSAIVEKNLKIFIERHAPISCPSEFLKEEFISSGVKISSTKVESGFGLLPILKYQHEK